MVCSPVYSYFLQTSKYKPNPRTRFDPALDTEIRTFSRSLLLQASQSAAGRAKDGGVGQYGNYASGDVSASEIFGDNVRRLEELKDKWDAENLFSYGMKLTPRPLVVVN